VGAGAAGRRSKDGLVAAVINFNTAALTRRCTRSLAAAGVPRIFVLDNASAVGDVRQLVESHAGDPTVQVLRSEENLGFAGGSNRLVDHALADPGCTHLLLLNSDAVAVAEGLDACLALMEKGAHDLMGGRMLKPPRAGEPAVVDSLGITLYKSLLASNRKSTGDAYLGPTGGFAIYSRRFLEESKRVYGYVFDPAYFCYAEDTDLCVRARLLKASVGYCDETVAYHEGQASNAGRYDDFILYHGIRNSIWMAWKSIPGWLLFTHLPWIVALHAGIVVRHTLQGRLRTLLRLYGDALAGLPRVLRERRAVQETRRVSTAEFRTLIDRKFYETEYVRGAVKDLYRR